VEAAAGSIKVRGASSGADVASLPQAMRNAREPRGHPRRLTYSSDFWQWVAFANIPTLPSRLT